MVSHLTEITSHLPELPAPRSFLGPQHPFPGAEVPGLNPGFVEALSSSGATKFTRLTGGATVILAP